MTIDPALLNAAAVAGATLVVQAVDKWLITPSRLRRLATDAADQAAAKAIAEHMRTCPGATLLQPVASDPAAT